MQYLKPTASKVAVTLSYGDFLWARKLFALYRLHFVLLR